MSEKTGQGLTRREFVSSSAALAVGGAVCGPLNSAEVDQQDERKREGSDSGDKPLHPDLQPIVLLPSRTVLMVIDMQRYFVQTAYPWGKAVAKIFPDNAPDYFKRLENVVVPNCQKLQKAFRAAQASVIYTAFGSVRNDGLDMPRWARGINVLGRESVGQALFPPFKDPSCQVDDSLAPAPDELVLNKSSSGPLNSTRLDQMLHTLGIDTLVVTGVVTEICVTQTAREFADRDFKVVVVEDACASMNKEHHKTALQIFSNCFGEVSTTDKVIASMAKAKMTN
jgi:nicotinamidase-related amidase